MPRTTALTTTLAPLANATDLPDFYEYYSKSGFAAELLYPALLLALCATVGLFGNISIAIVTWRTKSLHGTCNYLLSIGGAFDSLHSVSQYCFLYIALSGRNFMSHSVCVKILSPSIVGLNTGLLMTLFVGVDRLFSVLIPTRHRQFDTKLYIGIYLFLGFLDSAVWLYLSHSYTATHPDWQVNCMIPDTMPAHIASWWFTQCIVINALTVASYMGVWIVIKFKTGSKNDAIKRVFRSLTVIMFIVVIGWTVNACVRVVLPSSGIAPFYFFFVGSYFGVFVNAATASHVFVLYFFSGEYRAAIRRYLNAISRVLIRRDVFKERSMQQQGVTISVVPSSQGFVRTAAGTKSNASRGPMSAV